LAISLFTLFSVSIANAQVFMTELADPNNDATLRYIELYNAGTSDVIFTEGSGWRIDKYTNASATVSQTLNLTGTIPAKGFYLIATGTDNGNFLTIYGVTANQFDGAIDFVAGSNGDDNLELYNGANVLIDQFGIPGQDGTGTNHEFEDGRAERVATIVIGQPVYAEAEWTTWSDGPLPGGDFVATKDAPADFDPGAWIGHSDVIVAADLFFSEYIEGSSSNKALEIFNGTGADVDLTGYVVKLGNNGGAWGADGSSASLPLSGILVAGDVYVIANGLSIAGILDQADSTFLYSTTLEGHTVTAFNGDDALGLFKGAVLIDVIGTQGVDPGSGWPVAGVANATVDHTLVRKASVTAGTTDWAISAGTTVDDSEWIVNVSNFIDNLGIHSFGEPSDVTAPTFTANIGNGDINVAINTTIVLTFDEAIRNIDDSEITDANVATLLTLKETDAAGMDVAFTATIDADKKVITITPAADLTNGQVYYAAVAPVEDAAGNAAEASSMTFTTIAANASTISDVAITEIAPYFAGDAITITWVSSNVTDVKLEAWIPSENIWNELFATTPSDGTETFTIPADAQYSTEYKLRISDVANPLVTAESAMFTVIAVVNDLVSLRAQPANAIVKFTGIATVTYSRTAFNQKYIQDATAAILIHDPTTAPGFISGTYNVGDGITNIVGKIVLYNGLIEFTPTVATGEPATGIVIVPEIRTLASLTSADQCKLVKIENFAFKTPTQHDPTGLFVKSKNYDIDGFDNTLYAYRTAFAESDYIGGMVPVGVMSSVCLVGQFNTQMQITARSWSDMTLPFVLPSIVITEIMYTSPDVSAKQEWVELYNNGTTAVDMEGFYILDADPLHKADPIVLPAGSVIAPGEYFTIETSDDGKPELFPFVPDAISIKFNFGKTDEVKLFHSNGQLIDSVSYNSVDPWPTSPNGGGSSLTLCDPNLDNSLASSWEASEDEFITLQGTTIKATPGTGCVLHTAVAPKLQSGITVYPNPTSDNLYISNPANEQFEITVLSSIGKPVKSMQANQGVTSVDLSDLPKGIYMVKMLNKTSRKIQMQKVVVR